jgi:hypothetical protein
MPVLPNHAVYLINAEQAAISQFDGVLVVLGLRNPKSRVVIMFNFCPYSAFPYTSMV